MGFGYLDKSIKPLFVDNVEPTLENGKSGRFPISRKLYMYVNEAKISPEAQKFIDYLLSNEGQKIVQEAGFISIK